MMLFSVIIPCYNMANTIERAIESVKKQSYSNWELIIVNDGSTDSSYDFLDNHRVESKFFYYQISNQGVSAARNYGAMKSKGDYFLFLDADDELLPSALEIFHHNAQKFPPMIKGGYQQFNTQTKQSVNIVPSPNQYTAFIPGTFVIQSEVFKKIKGYDETLKYSENTELIFRVQKYEFHVKYIEDVLMKYFLSKSGGSKNIKNQSSALKIILSKHEDFLSPHVKFLYNQIIGVNCLRLNQYNESRFYLKKALKFKPWKFSTWIRFSITFLPVIAKKFYPIIDAE